MSWGRQPDAMTLSQAGTVAAAVPEGPSVGRPTRSMRVAPFAPPLVYLLAALYYFWPFLSDLGRQIPGGADGVIYGWFFQSVEQSVVHLHNPLFTTAMNAPDGVNVMWNTSLVAVAVLCVPVTAVLGGASTVMLTMMLAPVVSATCAYYALRRITGSTWGSALAASIFGFGPFFVGQNGHLHLTFAFVPPLLLLVGWELLVRQDRTALRTGTKLGVLIGLGLLVSEEIVALSAIVAVFAVAVLGVLHPRQVRPRLRYAATGTAIGAAVTALIAGYPLWFQFFGPQSLVRGPVSLQRLDLAGIVRPSQLQYYASDADVAANKVYAAIPVENTGYLGWPLVVLLIGFTFWLCLRGDRFGWWWPLTTAFAIGLSVGTPVMVDGSQLGIGPWSLVDALPLAETVVVVRFTLITTLLVAFLLAWVLAKKRGWELVGLSALVIATLVPLRPYGQYGTGLLVDTPRFFTTSAVDVIKPGATVLVLPRGQWPDSEAIVMMWQLRAGQRFHIVGGYGVFSVDGQISYIAPEPQYAQLLQQVGEIGAPPPRSEIDAARPSVTATHTRYIVLAGGQPNATLVERTAQQLTGCSWRAVADVRLCEIP
jgi:hypothetical protein